MKQSITPSEALGILHNQHLEQYERSVQLGAYDILNDAQAQQQSLHTDDLWKPVQAMHQAPEGPEPEPPEPFDKLSQTEVDKVEEVFAFGLRQGFYELCQENDGETYTGMLEFLEQLTAEVPLFEPKDAGFGRTLLATVHSLATLRADAEYKNFYHSAHPERLIIRSALNDGLGRLATVQALMDMRRVVRGEPFGGIVAQNMVRDITLLDRASELANVVVTRHENWERAAQR